MDELFSGRLSLQYILLEYYSPLLWGQNITQQGFGGEQQTVNNYFYIDNSYARILFMYGIIFFLFSNILCTAEVSYHISSTSYPGMLLPNAEHQTAFR